MRSVTALLALLAVSCVHSAPDPAEALRKRAERKALTKQDEPGAAQAYFEMKRQGASDRLERYDAAREQMRRMRGFSKANYMSRWSFLGPGNVGGRTRTLAIDPVNPSVMYMGGVSGGVWKTTNGGGSWVAIGDELANIAVNSMAMDPRDSNTLYVGTGEGYFREEVRGTGLPLRGNGIFVTRDAGATWTHLPSTINSDFHWVNDLAVSIHDSSTLYAATRTGVWRSTNAGATWTRVLATDVKGGCLDLAQRAGTAGDYLFASCGTFEQATVYRNVNAAANSDWSVVLREENMGRTSLAIAPSQPSTIYALSATNENTLGKYQGLLAVFRSDANGDPGTWRKTVSNDDPVKLHRLLLTNPLPATQQECLNQQDSFTTMGWYCNVIAVDPKDPERVWAAGVDLFRSDDGGTTWGTASYWWAGGQPSFAHADHHGIVFDPRYDGASNQVMYTVNDGGIQRTANARAAVAKGSQATCNPDFSSVRFASLNRDLGITQFYHGAVFPDGRSFIAGAQDNGTIMGSIDRGVNGWEMVWGGDGGYVVVVPQSPNVVIVESQFANIVKSLDGGGEFFPVRSGLTGPFLFITPIAADPSSSVRLWTGGARVFRSDDQADDWVPASTPLNGLVSAIGVARGNGNRVIVGTNSGMIYRTDQALTAGAETNWSAVLPRSGFLSWIEFDPVDSNIVYASYAGFGGTHLWKSVNAGATWSPLDGSGDSAIPDIPVHSIAIDPYNRSRIFLGTDLGVFVTTDGGSTWEVENTGYAPVVTETVVIGQGATGYAVYAFTHGRGVWRAELAEPQRRRTVRR